MPLFRETNREQRSSVTADLELSADLRHLHTRELQAEPLHLSAQHFLRQAGALSSTASLMRPSGSRPSVTRSRPSARLHNPQRHSSGGLQHAADNTEIVSHPIMSLSQRSLLFGGKPLSAQSAFVLRSYIADQHEEGSRIDSLKHRPGQAQVAPPSCTEPSAPRFPGFTPQFLQQRSARSRHSAVPSTVGIAHRRRSQA